MKNFIQINIEKNKTDSEYFLEGIHCSLHELVTELRILKAEIVHVTTYEQGRVLIDAYLPFLKEELFLKRLKAAAKAQI